jgi:hypothetical protein
MSSDFRVFNTIDPCILKEETGAPSASKSPACWPSEASAIKVDKSISSTVGKCHRAAYLRMLGFSVTNPAQVSTVWSWLIGRSIEERLTHQTQISGIYAANGVKHFISDIVLSLEFDVIVKNPVDNRGWILECKSYGGYFGKKEIELKGKPKLENLMQICLYLVECPTGAVLKKIVEKSLRTKQGLDKKVSELAAKGIEFSHRYRCEADLDVINSIDDGPLGAKLMYIHRDEGLRREFTIEIFKDFDGSHYPMVDGVPWKIFTIESIYERYRTIQGYWFRARSEGISRLRNKGILPPLGIKLILCTQDVQEVDVPEPKTEEQRKEELDYLSLLEKEVRTLPSSFWPPAEYDYSYSPERIEQLFQAEEIGKTNYMKYKKGLLKKLGDFHCGYCSYLGHCLSAECPELISIMADLNSILEDEPDIEF